MSKYIIDVGEAYVKHICGKGDMLCLPVRINEFEDNWLNTNIPLTPYTEPALEQVREEALEAIREEVLKAVSRIYDIPQDDRGGIFPKATYYVSDIMRKYSASEIIEKIKAYEEEQKKEEQSIRYEQIRQGLLGVAKACNAKMQELDEALKKMKEGS